MPNETMKSLRAENKRMRCLLAKVSATNETMRDDLARRRREVATLHRACAKHKRAKLVFAQRARKCSVPPKEDVCSRCEQMQHALDEVGKRSENISRMLDAESERIRTSYDEEMELSRKRAAESTARSQRSCQEAKEHLNRIRDEARRRFAEIAQQDFSVHARRLRNGFADAG